jgi:hypothetical protein
MKAVPAWSTMAAEARNPAGFCAPSAPVPGWALTLHGWATTKRGSNKSAATKQQTGKVERG